MPQSEDESHDESANHEAHRQKSVRWNDLFTELTPKDEEIVRHMEEKMKICSVNQIILQQARSSPIKDFESAVETICASYQQLDAIVTHKRDDFAEAADKLWVWSMAELWIRANLENQLQAKAFI